MSTTTALTIIKRAFSKAGIRAAETPLQASETQDGLDALNDLLAEWDAASVLKGVSPVEAVGDIVNAPRYAMGAIKSSLAAKIMGEYNKPMNATLAADISSSYNLMIQASTNLEELNYPSTLPLGSGNSNAFYETELEFFPETNKTNF
jgi:hypothetical protein